MKKKYKIVALIGESGSGKDSVLKEVIATHPEFNKIITCTTRPPREYEIDGVDYHFYSTDEFVHEIWGKEIVEYSVFNTWFYGTCKRDLKKDQINVGVFNPTSVRILLKDPECDVLVLYVRASDKERLLRQLTREEHPNTREIVRRALADYEDFDNLDFHYISVPNYNIRDLHQSPKEIVRWIKIYLLDSNCVESSPSANPPQDKID